MGKSSITTQLALSLCRASHSVGILDVDLTGPSIPRLFNIEDAKVTQAPGGWVPVTVHPSSTSTGGGSAIGELRCMSLGFLLRSRDDAVVWRGPKKTAMVRQFLDSVRWGALDYLLIDTPPGTSDEHISLAETLLQTVRSTSSSSSGGGGGDMTKRPPQLAGAVVVTTPQAVATADVRKELNFCAKTGIAVLGVVENMAGFVCPHCSECTNVFSSGGGRAMAAAVGVPFLGSVPLDPQFVRLVEEGRRPQYPAGTVVLEGGGDFADGDADAERSNGNAGLRDTLVYKYACCSLCPIFKRMTADLVARIKGAGVEAS